MKTQEELYNDTPPSLKEKGIRPFLKSETNSFGRFCADLIFENLLKQKFAAIRIKNLQNLQKRDMSKPNIIYAPHICWWDGILAYFLNRKVFNFDAIGMMENLHSLPFLRKIGAFSVDKKSPKVILESLTFASQSLNSPQKALYIFPQGIIRPQDHTPIKFSSGISYIASTLDGVNLIPLAIRYCFLRETSPEILVEVAEPMIFPKMQNRNETTRQLQRYFADLIENQRLEVANGKLQDYIPIWQKRDNLFRQIEKRIKPK